MADQTDPAHSTARRRTDSATVPVPVHRVLLPGADELMLERVSRRLSGRPRRATVRRSRARLLAFAVVTASLGAFAFQQLVHRLALLALLSSPSLTWDAGAQGAVSPPAASVDSTPAPLVSGQDAPAEASSVSSGSGQAMAEVTAAGVGRSRLAPARAPVVPAPPPARGPEAASDLDWRSLAERGAFAQAFAALGSQGLLWESERAASVSELFLLADVARRSGHAPLAVAPLEQVLGRFGGHPDASLAAFTLGKLQLDALDDAPRAVEAFERALKLELPPGLRRHAYARLIEALTRTGGHERARALAAEYERLFPEGSPQRSAP